MTPQSSCSDLNPDKAGRGQEEGGPEDEQLPVEAEPAGHCEPARHSDTLDELHQGEGVSAVLLVLGAEQ